MSAPLSAPRAIGLVASREFLTQVQKKSFLISNAIILIAIVAGIVAMSIFGGGEEDRPAVGIVGGSSLNATLGAVGEATALPSTSPNSPTPMPGGLRSPRVNSTSSWFPATAVASLLSPNPTSTPH